MKLWQVILTYILAAILTIAITLASYVAIAYIVVKVVKAIW
jgi:hypothetical protein